MRWLILIGDADFNLNTIKSIKHEGCVRCYDVDIMRYCVEYGENHIFYDYDEIIDDYEEDLAKIPYISPHFIIMVYTSGECVKHVLQLESFPKNIYIDNDHGIILPIEEFIRLGMPLDKDETSSIKRFIDYPALPAPR